MKKIVALGMALVMALALTACGGAATTEAPAATEAAKAETKAAATEAAKKEEAAPAAEAPAEAPAFNPADYPVCICMDTYNHPVHRTVQLGFINKAHELGYTNAKVIGTDLGDSAAAWENGLQWAKAGGKGLLLWAGDSSCYEVLKQISDTGCLVGTPHFNHYAANGNKLPEGMSFNMACSPTLYGQQVAELLAEKLDGKTGSVCITLNTHNLTEDAADESFRETWAKMADKYNLSGLTLLDTELEGGDLVEATSIIQGILGAHPDIVGAFGTTGNSPQSWANAAANVGKADGEIAIVGMDATEANLQNLVDGKVVAIVAQPLVEEAAKTMEYFDVLFQGGTVPEWTDLEAPIVTADGEGQNGPAFHQDVAAQVTAAQFDY